MTDTRALLEPLAKTLERIVRILQHSGVAAAEPPLRRPVGGTAPGTEEGPPGLLDPATPEAVRRFGVLPGHYH